MNDERRTPPPPGRPRAHRQPVALLRRVTAVGAGALLLAGCGLFAQPTPNPPPGPVLAPPGTLAYVVCAGAVTPVELATSTPEAAISLHLPGTPALGDYAIAVGPGGRMAYVDTSPLVNGTPRDEVVPVDLVTQRAGTPIGLPGTGGTHAIVVSPDGTTVWAASGGSIVPVDVGTGHVGTPVRVPSAGTVSALVFDPSGSTLYVLGNASVVPVSVASHSAGPAIATSLTVSSTDSPHGMTLDPAGRQLVVVGQGGSNFGGRILTVPLPSGPATAPASFDVFGSVASPSAVAVTPDGKLALVADGPNNWVVPVKMGTTLTPDPPLRMPVQSGAGGGLSTQHPTDLVLDPGGSTAWIVTGFDALLPLNVSSLTYGSPVPVCAGAASVALAPSPASG
ncbi:MAG: hypothetical protein M0Z62_09170 [Actinomycetota bacterium]|nr:hypothetical protein [Actinomycetota bacterium]